MQFHLRRDGTIHRNTNSFGAFDHDRGVEIAYLIYEDYPDEGHYMGIIPADYLEQGRGYPDIVNSILSAETGEDMGAIFHRVFGYNGVNFEDANIYEFNAPCLSAYEGRLLAEVMVHNAQRRSSQLPELQEVVDLWLDQIRNNDTTRNTTPHTGVNVVTQESSTARKLPKPYTPMFTPGAGDEASAIPSNKYSQAGHRNAFGKRAGISSTIEWRGGVFGQIQFPIGVLTRISYERLYRPKNIFLKWLRSMAIGLNQMSSQPVLYIAMMPTNG